jgi:hypothetical protein
VFRAEVASALQSALDSALDSGVCIGWTESHRLLWVSSASADSLRCHFGKEGIWVSGIDEA